MNVFKMAIELCAAVPIGRIGKRGPDQQRQAVLVIGYTLGIIAAVNDCNSLLLNSFLTGNWDGAMRPQGKSLAMKSMVSQGTAAKDVSIWEILRPDFSARLMIMGTSRNESPSKTTTALSGLESTSNSLFPGPGLESNSLYVLSAAAASGCQIH